MAKNKKANISFTTIISLVIAIIAFLLMLFLVSYFFKGCSDPDKVNEGLVCRTFLQTSSRVEEFTQGILKPDKIFDFCHTIPKTIPLQSHYSTIGGKVSRSTSAEEFRKIIAFDFAKLISNAWWISGEGERSEYIVKNIFKLVASENNCMVIYAVRIDPPREYPGFKGITEEQLITELKAIQRQEIRAGAKGDDRNILEYLTFDGYGAGVFLKDKEAKIELEQGGNDAVYAIAVGFADEEGISKIWGKIVGSRPAPINTKASFIFITPYNEIIGKCLVI